MLFNRFEFCIYSCAGHGSKTGTNLHAALQSVEFTIKFFKENRARYDFNETQNIIIIATDGKDAVKFQS